MPGQLQGGSREGASSGEWHLSYTRLFLLQTSLSTLAGKRPASSRDPPVPLFPRSQTTGTVGRELCRDLSPIPQDNAQTFPRLSVLTCELG